MYPAETLEAQLRRIGVAASVAVTLAAALATFALLTAVIPLSHHAGTPRAVKPSLIPSRDLQGSSSDPNANAAELNGLRRRSIQQMQAIEQRNAAAARARGGYPVRQGSFAVPQAPGQRHPSQPPSSSASSQRSSGGAPPTSLHRDRPTGSGSS